MKQLNDNKTITNAKFAATFDDMQGQHKNLFQFEDEIIIQKDDGDYFHNNRVLIVDDDQRICRITKRVAENLGIESFATDNPELFEPAYLDFKPSIIFMDLQMQKLDGIELLRNLAKLRTKATIVLVSGMDKNVLNTTEELGKSLGLNMAGILQKPIDIDKAKMILGQNFEPASIQTQKATTVTGEELENAITQNELVVHYQPQVHLASGKIVGLEALVRWQHPKHGLLFPDAFIPLAEQNKDLIELLTYSVLNNVLQCSTLKKEKTSDLNVSINLSTTMLHDLSLPDKMTKMLAEHDFNPDRLIVEITESGAMEDPALTMDILTRLRLKNIRLSIDDFGTGFSSLVQLYRMPFNEIKVDKSFVMKAMDDEEAATIVRTTIELGHGLGLEVVAEGIEDKKTFNWLKELGCDTGQGYFISRPVDADDLESWVKEYSQN